jgi:antitoxin (DNA-binding transcriptional repressor) of toxin-antitoxin stability system
MSSPRKISKGVLKAKMLEYFRDIERTGQDLIVTDNNKPVLRISSISQERKTAKEVFKKYRGKVKYKEDVNTPTSNEWEDL